MTHAQRMLDAIEAALEGRVTADVQSYQISGRSITKIPIAELMTLRKQYMVEVANERVATELEQMGKKKPKRILYHFGR